MKLVSTFFTGYHAVEIEVPDDFNMEFDNLDAELQKYPEKFKFMHPDTDWELTSAATTVDGDTHTWDYT